MADTGILGIIRRSNPEKEFEIMKQIGSGTYGEVYQVRNNINSHVFVMVEGVNFFLLRACERTQKREILSIICVCVCAVPLYCVGVDIHHLHLGGCYAWANSNLDMVAYLWLCHCHIGLE